MVSVVSHWISLELCWLMKRMQRPWCIGRVIGSDKQQLLKPVDEGIQTYLLQNFIFLPFLDIMGTNIDKL